MAYYVAKKKLKNKPTYWLLTVICLCGLFFWASPGCGREEVCIGILNHAVMAEGSIAGFKDAMREFGYQEPDDIEYFYQGAVSMGELEKAAQKILDHRIDLILTLTMPATVAAKKAVKKRHIPIVFAPNSDPVGAGLVASLERPGGNITGVSFWLQEGKRLEWLVKVAPNVRRIWVPFMVWDKSPEVALDKLKQTAEKLDLFIIEHPLKDYKDLLNSPQHIDSNFDAIFLPADALVCSNAEVFVKKADKLGMPVSSPNLAGVKKGALIGYGFTQYQCGRQGARLAALILDGEDPGELPVEMSEIFLMINLKKAKELKIPLPREVVGQADILIR
jgi:putative ABC transport system substrate-binding protein